MAWEVVFLREVEEWYEALLEHEPETAASVAAALDILEEVGPALGRPLVDTLQGTAIPNLKELRPGARGFSKVRILFAFDPGRQAVLLVAGDNAGRWSTWYTKNIPIAEKRYRRWLKGDYS